MNTSSPSLMPADRDPPSFLLAVSSLLLLGLIPGAWIRIYSGRDAWSEATLPVWAVPAALVVAGLLAWLLVRLISRSVSIFEAAFAGCVSNTLVLGFLHWSGVSFGRSAVAVSYATAMAIFAGLLWVQGVPRFRLAGWWVATILLLFANLASPEDPSTSPGPLAQRVPLESSLYGLELRTYRRHIELPFAMGGGVAPLPDGRVLLVTGDGVFFLLEEDASELSLGVVPLDLQVPINQQAFRTYAEGTRIEARRFRVADLLVTVTGDVATILVSHHHFRVDEECVVVRISRMETPLTDLGRPEAAGRWATLFETSPCLPMKEFSNVFAGHQIGGRLALLDPEHLLLSVGDHEFDGVNSEIDLPQDPAVDYGKILRVNLRSGQAEIMSFGHRNPQGLLVTPEGEVWSTEHGPEGGDELNRILRDRNYGWPLVTYGTNYGFRSWQPNPVQGRHDRFEEPVFAWVPSIGISNLIQVQGDQFPLWRGDLIVSSMVGRSIFRIRLVDGKPVLVEPIRVPMGVRDLKENVSGDIILWAKGGEAIGFLSPRGPDPNGSEVFAACAECHALGTGTQHRIGPDLANILGRGLGQAPGYEYSRALAEAGGVWTEANLDAYLAEPSAFLPGTSMQFPGIADPDVRRAVIEYLARPRQGDGSRVRY